MELFSTILAVHLFLSASLGLSGLNAPLKQDHQMTAQTSIGTVEREYAPEFILTTLDGKEVRLSDFKGKKVILNFWASWCSPCKSEMPVMQHFYENHHNKMEIVAVNLTSAERNKMKIKQFVGENKLTFPVLLDTMGSVGHTYQILTIPTTYMLNEDGKIIQKYVGPLNEEIMKEFIDNE
ncbi:TlpA family protein disulfide reductase [Metabacillus arenae]|uniref:Redoxin domain-containing protein n=1 Tax=Metabacillus arenae TaxID=2771434 RepID=A0A926NA60_9BACI|nr:redoxin family protein [Metabacillus arenae]MBD1380407.1 redoxin domain-containing protein [Metabacillus arenae]